MVYIMYTFREVVRSLFHSYATAISKIQIADMQLMQYYNWNNALVLNSYVEYVTPENWT